MISRAEASDAYFLGPLGDPDPSEVIITKMNHIPFKNAPMDPSIWEKSLRNWPSPVSGWRDWYLKMANKEQSRWVTYHLDQCISLSLSGMKNNEPLLKAACYFWNGTFNAFFFGHGPMMPSLADVHMLTGLKITGSPNPSNILIKPHTKLHTRCGWSQYIKDHQSKKKSPNEKERVAFLNMWLDKFLFCGSSCGPTANYLGLVEKLYGGTDYPLGKLLLGSLYHMLNQASQHLMKGESVPTITGPWWFLQLWLNIHLHKFSVLNIRSLTFPALTFLEEDEEQLSPKQKLCRCTSFGEAASAISLEGSIGHFFRCFYKGFPDGVLSWDIYFKVLEFESPSSFRFEIGCTDDVSLGIFNCIIKTCLLPTEVRHGREKDPISYEFHNPVMAARQIGLGQVPPGLFYADKIKAREPTDGGLEFSRLLQFENALPLINVTDIDC